MRNLNAPSTGPSLPTGNGAEAHSRATDPRPSDAPPGPPGPPGLRVWALGNGFRPEAPTLVALHGVLHDHSLWEALASGVNGAGWNLLAVDLPGHGASAGVVLGDVADTAQHVLRALDAWPLDRWACVGHSLGSLVALRLAAAAPQRTSHLALVGSACPMRVSPALLEAAGAQPEHAMALIAHYSFAEPGPQPGTPVPDESPQGQLMAQMRRLLALGGPDVLQRGLQACADYANGAEDMATVAAAGIPCLLVAGTNDRMTPAKAVKRLEEAAAQTGHPATTALLQCGHAHLREDPNGVQAALNALLRTPTRAVAPQG